MTNPYATHKGQSKPRRVVIDALAGDGYTVTLETDDGRHIAPTPTFAFTDLDDLASHIENIIAKGEK